MLNNGVDSSAKTNPGTSATTCRKLSIATIGNSSITMFEAFFPASTRVPSVSSKNASTTRRW